MPPEEPSESVRLRARDASSREDPEEIQARRGSDCLRPAPARTSRAGADRAGFALGDAASSAGSVPFFHDLSLTFHSAFGPLRGSPFLTGICPSSKGPPAAAGLPRGGSVSAAAAYPGGPGVPWPTAPGGRRGCAIYRRPAEATTAKVPTRTARRVSEKIGMVARGRDESQPSSASGWPRGSPMPRGRGRMARSRRPGSGRSRHTYMACICD